MKKLIYIFSLLAVTLSGCVEESINTPGTGGDDDSGYATLSFTANIPDYRLVTRAETFTNLYLMTFDADGKFLGRFEATYTQPDVNDKGTGSARIPIVTRVIHFVANHDWAGYGEAALLEQSEAAVMPALTGGQRVCWGRVEVASLYDAISVELLRNYAKVTVVDETETGTGQIKKFKLNGFALGNYSSTGTIATFGESGAGSFAPAEDKLTLPAPASMTYANDAANVNMDPKYMFETNNPESNPTSVIIRNEANRFYKLHLLKDDVTLEPWKIERNYHYKVILKSFEEDPWSNGVGSYEEAMQAAPANNLYAEIVKESPVISDANSNRLELERLAYLYTSPTATSLPFSIQANYYPSESATADNAGMEFRITEDVDGILSGLALNNGQLTGNVAIRPDGQREASVRISKNNLSRIVRIISAKPYSFDAQTPIIYNGKDVPVSLSFNIPDDYPEALFPVKCKIHATNLYPVAPNKNMLVVQENGTYYYMYEAWQTGEQEVQFQTSMPYIDETVTIENPYFTTAEVQLVPSVRLNTITVGGTYYRPGLFGDTAANGTITVSYSRSAYGTGSGSDTFEVSGGTPTNATREIQLPSDVTEVTLTHSYNLFFTATITVSVSDLMSGSRKTLE